MRALKMRMTLTNIPENQFSFLDSFKLDLGGPGMRRVEVKENAL
jgi:hypothetical protein